LLSHGLNPVRPVLSLVEGYAMYIDDRNSLIYLMG